MKLQNHPKRKESIETHKGKDKSNSLNPYNVKEETGTDEDEITGYNRDTRGEDG